MIYIQIMFCDELNLKLVAGKGGDGAATFRREKFVPRGGPDGGDGGRGGNIVFKVNPQINTLSNLANKKIYKANQGVNGQKKNMHGKNAEALVLEVPKGTIIFNKDKSQVIADLDKEGNQATVARGGKGGLGNARFASSTHQAPRFAETGEPGEEIEITLELKMVADIGLIGLPSAGKSTLISVISNAKPKIAAYHFTTLIPNLGVVNMAKHGGSANSSFVVADIPGLIEGASQGKGLGYQFLKHISRTKVLVHIIDGTLENIGEDFQTINQELEEFDSKLASREQIIVLNKIDMLDEDTLKKKLKEIKKVAKNTEIFIISAITREGLQPLLFEMVKKLQEVKLTEKPEEEIEEKGTTILQPHLETTQFEIEKIIRKKDKKIFRIRGKRIEQVLIMTDLRNLEGLERVYHFIDKMGIKKAIEKEGATFGDVIMVKEKSFPYRK